MTLLSDLVNAQELVQNQPLSQVVEPLKVDTLKSYSEEWNLPMDTTFVWNLGCFSGRSSFPDLRITSTLRLDAGPGCV